MATTYLGDGWEVKPPLSVTSCVRMPSFTIMLILTSTLPVTGKARTYVMRAINSLGAYVFWKSATADSAGNEFTGGNKPLSDVCIFTVL